MHVRFFTVRGGFARVCGRFARVRGRFACARDGFARVRGSFARVRGSFARVRGSFARVRGRFARVRGHFAPVRGSFAGRVVALRQHEKPHLIVGIEAEGDFENVVREAGTVAADTAPAGEPVDLIRVIRGESGIGQYFLEKVKPFFEREGANDVSVVSNTSSKQGPLKGWVSRMLRARKSG